MEKWKDIKGYEGLYKVSNRGRVKSLPKKRENWRGGEWTQPGKILKPGKGHYYPRVNLCSKGQKRHYIHHLVARHFIGERPKGLSVLHKDDDPLNNHVDNLYYGTQKQNMKDSKRNGGACIGEDAPDTKLTKKQVLEIHDYDGDLSCYKLSKKYPVGPEQIRRIQKEMTWRHLWDSQQFQ